MEQGVQSVFPTPMAYYYNTEIIDDLKSYIMSLETKGIESKVAVKIKHNLIESDFNLFHHDNDTIKKTSKWIGNCVAKTVNHIQMENHTYKINFNESWYHITKTNGMHEPHIHPSCSWCGIYYLKSGNDDSGHTVFENPTKSTYIDRGNLYLNNISTVRVKPRDGMLVLFPSYLSHYQAMYKGTEDRIVIAFNSSITDIIREED